MKTSNDDRMNRVRLVIIVGYFLFSGCGSGGFSPMIELRTASFAIQISSEGRIRALTDLERQTNYLAADTASYLMSLRIDGDIKVPLSATAWEDSIQLQYEGGIWATLGVEEKQDYLSLELLALSNKDSVDLIIWGPYYTTIDQVIGETVGVVRDADMAIGIQALNIKTLGGYPWNESDRMPAFDIFREEDATNMHPNSDGSVLYRVEAAKPTESGSSLQAYCRNRSQSRIIADFNHDKIVAPAYEDGGVLGTKIALFGVPTAEALAVLGAIEMAEGLPHPMIDGEWGKTAPAAAAAYIITDFTEDNVEQAIALTKRAGLRYLYHYGKTFDNWGHFDLYKGEFPNGMAGLKACVDQAAAEGVMLGTHFLSNFITPNDPYVTPIPDPRLAKVGTSTLRADIGPADTRIPIVSPDFFNQMKNNHLKTVQIGEELVRYDRVSAKAPWTLLDCQRGAFGTQVAAHTAGTRIAKLLDHGYKVFLTEADLTIELSKRMADIYNQTGLRQISFDGLEGNRSTGLGTYGESLMPYTWYQALEEEIKAHLIIDASRTTHFFWHIYSRMNWGEPWYGGFRESQTEYRFNNQAYFKRNYMPGMLGWFKMTPETSLEDMEWLLAHSAGYDAGYAFVANMESIEKNGQSDQILALIGDWEKLRLSGVFSEEQKELFRHSGKEFSLRKINEKQWDLWHIHTEVFYHEDRDRQPGQPGQSVFEWNHLGEEQAFHFILSCMGEEVSDLVFEMNNYKEIRLPWTMKQGQILKYTGGDQAILYDAHWRALDTLAIDPSDFRINRGKHTIALDAAFATKEEGAKVKLELRAIEKVEKITLDENRLEYSKS